MRAVAWNVARRHPFGGAMSGGPMKLQIEAVLDYWMAEPADVLLAIEAAPMDDQRIVEDQLTIASTEPLHPVPGEEGIGRRTWMHASGPFHAEYRATIEVERGAPAIERMAIGPRRQLPAFAVPYLWPSRYCESDRFEAFVERQFGRIDGGAKAVAMAGWIHDHLAYVPGSSDGRTSAADTFLSRQGVCRDFAHLMASFARAAGIPARLVSAYAWRLDPPDFHAVVELWLDGAWRLIDATRLAPVEGLVRIAVGRDATDIAFMTAFGSCSLNEQRVAVHRVD
jgi:transglutaminase-like putative cysteine protease